MVLWASSDTGARTIASTRSCRTEKELAFISDLMGWFRSICGHVVGSDKAKASLRYIAVMIAMGPADGDGSSAGSLWYAPQRWISSSTPMSAMTEKLDHLCLYFEELRRSKVKKQQAWVEDRLLPFSDLEFYLVLNGVIDILEIFGKLSASLQGFYIDMWRAMKKRKVFEEELSDLVMREKAKEGKGPSTFISVALAWWNGEELQGQTRLAKVLRRLQLTDDLVPEKEKQNKCKSEPEYRRKCEYKVAFASNALEKKEIVYKVTVQTNYDILDQKGLSSPLRECLLILRAFGKISLDDLKQRFSNDKVVVWGLVVYDLTFDREKGPVPLDALVVVAKFFKLSQDEFVASWQELHRVKDMVVKDSVAAVGGHGLAVSDLDAHKCWGQTLMLLDKDPEKTRPAPRPDTHWKPFCILS